MDKQLSKDTLLKAIDHYWNMGSDVQWMLLEKLPSMLENLYGSHRTLTVGKGTPIHDVLKAARFCDPERNTSTIDVKPVTTDPCVQREYYELESFIRSNSIPTDILSVIRRPCTNLREFINHARLIEDWYTKINDIGGEKSFVAFAIYKYIYQSVRISEAIDDELGTEKSHQLMHASDVIRDALEILDPNYSRYSSNDSRAVAIKSFYDIINPSIDIRRSVLYSYTENNVTSNDMFAINAMLFDGSPVIESANTVQRAGKILEEGAGTNKNIELSSDHEMVISHALKIDYAESFTEWTNVPIFTKYCKEHNISRVSRLNKSDINAVRHATNEEVLPVNTGNGVNKHYLEYSGTWHGLVHVYTYSDSNAAGAIGEAPGWVVGIPITEDPDQILTIKTDDAFMYESVNISSTDGGVYSVIEDLI